MGQIIQRVIFKIFFLLLMNNNEFTKILLLLETHQRPIGDPLETNMPDWRTHQRPIGEQHAWWKTCNEHPNRWVFHLYPECGAASSIRSFYSCTCFLRHPAYSDSNVGGREEGGEEGVMKVCPGLLLHVVWTSSVEGGVELSNNLMPPSVWKNKLPIKSEMLGGIHMWKPEKLRKRSEGYRVPWGTWGSRFYIISDKA